MRDDRAVWSPVACAPSQLEPTGGNSLGEDVQNPRASTLLSHSHQERGPDSRVPHLAGSASARRALDVLVLSLVALLLGACASTLVPPPPTPQTTAIYRIGAPDRLLVSVLPEPVIEREATVRPDGRISIDLIGDVEVSGRTAEEIAEAIRSEISRFKRDAVVTVSVVAANSSTVTLFGMISRPGTMILQRNTRVAEAVGSAGGATIYASKGRVRVIRSDSQATQVLAVNLRHIQHGDQSTNVMLQDGDIIVVPPNALARIGFALQTILFPFQQVLSAGRGALLFGGP